MTSPATTYSWYLPDGARRKQRLISHDAYSLFELHPFDSILEICEALKLSTDSPHEKTPLLSPYYFRALLKNQSLELPVVPVTGRNGTTAFSEPSQPTSHRAFLFMGDNIYADTDDPNIMKEKYRNLNTQPDYAALAKTSPYYPNLG